MLGASLLTITQSGVHVAWATLFVRIPDVAVGLLGRLRPRPISILSRAPHRCEVMRGNGYIRLRGSRYGARWIKLRGTLAMQTLGGHVDSELHEKTSRNTASATKHKIEIHARVTAYGRGGGDAKKGMEGSSRKRKKEPR